MSSLQRVGVIGVLRLHPRILTTTFSLRSYAKSLCGRSAMNLLQRAGYFVSAACATPHGLPSSPLLENTTDDPPSPGKTQLVYNQEQ